MVSIQEQFVIKSGLFLYVRTLLVLLSLSNVCSHEKYTKRSSVLLLRLVYFSAEQTLLIAT